MTDCTDCVVRDRCAASHGSYHCTRVAGHPGSHVACVGDQHGAAIWTIVRPAKRPPAFELIELRAAVRSALAALSAVAQDVPHVLTHPHFRVAVRALDGVSAADCWTHDAAARLVRLCRYIDDGREIAVVDKEAV